MASDIFFASLSLLLTRALLLLMLIFGDGVNDPMEVVNTFVDCGAACTRTALTDVTVTVAATGDTECAAAPAAMAVDKYVFILPSQRPAIPKTQKNLPTT